MISTHPVPRTGSSTTQELLPALGSPHRFTANEVIFLEGDAADEVQQVVAGVVRLSKLLADGRRAVLGFRYPGELLLPGLAERHGCSAEAVTEVVLRAGWRQALDAAAARSPELRHRLSALLWAELGAAHASLLRLGRMTAAERVASFLLTLGRGARAEGWIALPMSRLDIADHLGLTVETVSRVISQFRRRGLIALRGAHDVRLLRPAALRPLTGGDDGQADEDDRAMSPAHQLVAAMQGSSYRPVAAVV